MKLLYFSWIRERVGMNEEVVDLDDNIKTVSDLMSWLKSRGDGFEAVFEHPQIIRVALDQEHVDDLETSLEHTKEVALFPPMTGG